jgi:hypothetical protein
MNSLTQFIIVLVALGHIVLLQNPGDLSVYDTVYHQEFDSLSSVYDFNYTNPEIWDFSPVGDTSGVLAFNGPSIYQPPVVRSPATIGLLTNFVFSDFRLDLDFKHTRNVLGSRSLCVFFNFQNPSEYYYVEISEQYSPQSHNIFIVDNRPPRGIGTGVNRVVNWSDGEWHRVRIERSVAFGVIKIYVDDMDTPIMQAEDVSFGTGYIGFGAFDDSGMIDNIAVHAPYAMNSKQAIFNKKEVDLTGLLK